MLPATSSSSHDIILKEESESKIRVNSGCAYVEVGSRTI